MKPIKVEFECSNCGCKAIVESVKEDLTKGEMNEVK